MAIPNSGIKQCPFCGFNDNERLQFLEDKGWTENGILDVEGIYKCKNCECKFILMINYRGNPDWVIDVEVGKWIHVPVCHPFCKTNKQCYKDVWFTELGSVHSYRCGVCEEDYDLIEYYRDRHKRFTIVQSESRIREAENSD